MTGAAIFVRRRRSLLAGVAAVGALLGGAPPAAADTASLVARTCNASPDGGREPVSRARLAAFILADEGILLDHATASQEDEEAWIIRAFASRRPSREQQHVRDAVGLLQEQLGSRSGPGSRVVGLEAVPAGEGARPDGWLFSPGVTLFCDKRGGGGGGGGNRASGGSLIDDGRLNIRLRATADELGLTGSRRLTAGAATITYQRDRIEQIDGTRRHDTTIGVRAAVGVVLSDSPSGSAMLFGAYQLQQLRVTPAPALAPGARERDKDTDVLELGLNVRRLFGRGIESEFNLDLTGRGSVVFDRVANSERLRFTTTATPDIPMTLPFCSFGYFYDLGFGLGGRCTVAARAQANFYLDRGTRAPTANDEFALAGGEIGIEFAEMRNGRVRNGGGIIAGASYRYEASLLGDVPDIERLSSSLKYRRWFGGNRFAIEGGVTYLDGTNPDTFADEHRILVGAGLIF